ncbi:MAG: glycosyltransferase family 1 protein [Lachnospiraceae bacterium]|nr:glycosyltransferase family 1 protein [Lachnospiraceae bacterium]
MKVLMVAGSMHVGGLENQLMHFIRNVNRDEVQVDFTSDKPDAFYRDEIKELGGNFIILSNKSRNHPIKYCRELYKIMKEGKYDIVHSHELFHSGMTLFIAKLAGVPCRFAHAHSCREGNEEKEHYSLARRIYHVVMRLSINTFSTTQIACSTWAAKFLFGKKVLKKDSFSLIYNSVDTSIFLNDYGKICEGEYTEKDGWKNVINVARICGLKNHTLLVEIARELKDRKKKIRIICVGDGDEDIKEALNQKILEYNVEDYILFVGVRSDVDKLLKKSSAFILPSRYEGMPLVMIEAQAVGLPCLTADTYSKEVDFEIGMVKWLSLSQNVATWADELEKLVLLGRAPKEKVEKAINTKGFDSKIFTNKIYDLYKKDYELRGNI